MANKSGVLSCSNGKLEVDFGSVLWWKSHGQQQEIRNFWEKQGYMEAEPLPYERSRDALIVKRNLESYGWALAGNVDRQQYEIPF